MKQFLKTTLNREDVSLVFEYDHVFDEVIIESVEYKGTEVLPLISDEQYKELVLSIYEKLGSSVTEENN